MLVELQNKRTAQLAKFQPGDRTIKELDQEIGDTKRALAAADNQTSTEQTTDVNPLRQTLEGELSKAELNDTEYRSRVASLTQDIAAYRKGLSGLESATTSDEALLRQIKEAEENFFLYSKKREEARIVEAMDQQRIANVALVQPPRVPALPLPKPSVSFIAAYALGCCLLTGICLLIGTMRRTVDVPWELEQLTGLPVLGTSPELRALAQYRQHGRAVSHASDNAEVRA
jgi:uncharacterized protein involved in exopolysaccharide biosynthesis